LSVQTEQNYEVVIEVGPLFEGWGVARRGCFVTTRSISKGSRLLAGPMLNGEVLKNVAKTKRERLGLDRRQEMPSTTMVEDW